MNSVFPSQAPPRPLSLLPVDIIAVPAPKHPQEAARLEALHALDILDTAADQRFDRLTALAADLFEVPVAVVSLVDENRQWFKSACGLDAKETPRDISFCAHAILEEAILVIEDAKLDPRFAQNPLVVGPPFVRFYAGVILRTATNLPLGTLCIAGSTPRKLDRASRRRLFALGQLVEQEIDHHHDLRSLRALMSKTGMGH